jgi:hypothetical protein
MSSALDEFRAQREAAEQIENRLAIVCTILKEVRRQADALVNDQKLRDCVNAERDLVDRMRDMVRDLRAFREEELRRFWPGVWRRWVVAVAFAIVASFALGSGYIWASRPYEAELATLRSRVELLDYVAQRVLKMSPGERREFDSLMKLDDSHRR